jgi:hypothetical protein
VNDGVVVIHGRAEGRKLQGGGQSSKRGLVRQGRGPYFAWAGVVDRPEGPC